jgi:four helix bundle protein
MTKNFEDFPVYIKSLDLIEKVYAFLRSQGLEKEFEFSNQIKRAGFSISNNIAEGSEYNNNRQFIKYLKENIERS